MDDGASTSTAHLKASINAKRSKGFGGEFEDEDGDESLEISESESESEVEEEKPTKKAPARARAPKKPVERKAPVKAKAQAQAKPKPKPKEEKAVTPIISAPTAGEKTPVRRNPVSAISINPVSQSSHISPEGSIRRVGLSKKVKIRSISPVRIPPPLYR